MMFIGVALFLPCVAEGQPYLPPAPPTSPADYGKVILDSRALVPGSPGPVVFQHWLHRSRFTCRVCHVDIGFAMEAKTTGIRAETNRQGFHCGACHDGKKLFDGKPIFAACTQTTANSECDRCHSVGKRGVTKYEYSSFTAKLPKAAYGIDWQQAEARGLIKLADYVEGVSSHQREMKSRADFTITAGLPWVYPVTFSHQKHAVWNGCELCHPDIFATASRTTVRYTMFSNIEGKHCGACHLKVAFPLNNCQYCHPRAPSWAQQ
jgi:c(7)-type cytochrome triheme protein